MSERELMRVTGTTIEGTTLTLVVTAEGPELKPGGGNIRAMLNAAMASLGKAAERFEAKETAQ